MRRTIFVMAALVALAVGGACQGLEDEVNEATARTEEFQEELDETPIAQSGGVCSPAPIAFDDLMSGSDWWVDAREHIDAVEIDGLNYRVTNNNTDATIRVDLYLSDVVDVTQVPEADYLASTADLPPKWVDTTWQPFNLTSDGEDRLAELILEPDTAFTICAKIPQVESGEVAAEQVSLVMRLEIAGAVTFVPITD